VMEIGGLCSAGGQGASGGPPHSGRPWEPWTQRVPPWPETITAPEPGEGGPTPTHRRS
jgi:hypothetical protein